VLFVSLIKGIDWLADQTGKIFSTLIVFIILTMSFEVVARYVFNNPTLWSYDLTYMLGGVLFLLTTPYVLLHHGDVRVDVFYHSYSPRQKRIVDLVLSPIILFPVLCVFVSQSWDFALRALAMNEKAMGGILEPSMVRFRFAIALGFSLLALEGVAWFIRDLFFVLKGKEIGAEND